MSRATCAAICAALCALLFGPQARAADLYSATVPVADQSAEERDAALRNALSTVLVRVTGDRQINSWGDTEPLLANARALVQRYGYERVPATETEPVGLKLIASFDGQAVQREIRQYGLPLWGGQRPEHLLWVALRDDGQPRALIDQTTADERVPIMREVAQERGLPISFPLLDLQDRRQLNFADVWGGFSENVAIASQRYSAQQTVTAAIGQEGGLWVGRWTLLDGNQVQDSWIITEQSLEDVLAQGVHSLADRQAARLATRSAGYVQTVKVRVRDVFDLYDYGRVLNAFKELNAVKAVLVSEVAQEEIQLRLRFEGDAGTLQRAISLNRMLEAVRSDISTDPFGRPQGADQFSYRLVR